MTLEKLPDILTKCATSHPDRIGLALNGEEIVTYGEWDRRSNAMAWGLRQRGIGRGDRVALMFGNHEWINFAVTYFGVLKAGAIAVLLSDRLARSEFLALLESLSVKAVIAESTVAPETPECWVETPRNLEARNPSIPLHCGGDARDIAEVVLTSGTTGTPKAVAVSHSNLLPVVAKPEHSAVLHSLPIATTAAQMSMADCLGQHNALVVLSRFSSLQLCELVRRYSASTVVLAPVMGRWLIREKVHQQSTLPMVRSLIFLGAPFPVSIVPELHQLFPNARLRNVYTSTEAAPAVVSMEFDPTRPDSVGRPALGTSVRVVDGVGKEVRAGEIGEIWLEGPSQRRSYVDDSAASERVFQESWTRTGDRGYLDSKGYLYLIERQSDLINVGGIKVSAREVEAVLERHPAVTEAAAVGVPHEVLGHSLAAAVECTAPISSEALLRYAQRNLGPSKTPSRIDIFEELPRNAMGKVEKPVVKAKFGESSARKRELPKTKVEAVLYRAWREVLDRGDFGSRDDFLELGGHSLATARVVARIRDALGVEVPFESLFQARTIVEQMEVIRSFQVEKHEQAPRIRRRQHRSIREERHS